MPRFAFQARDEAGRAIQGIELALDEADLDRRLATMDLFLVDARVLRRSLRRARGSRGLIDFCYHLAIVIEAGIPLLQGLQDIGAEDSHPLAEVVQDVTRKIEGGSTLSAALADYPAHFPPLVVASVRAGEATGQLDRILHDLVRYLEWREGLKRQIVSAASYPALVLTGIVALCILLVGWVLPRFLEIFVELGVALPLPTRILLVTQQFLHAYWPHLLLVLCIGAVGAWLFGRSDSGRLRVHQGLLRLPVVGGLISMIEMSRFSHNLGVLYGAGLPVLQALEMVEDAIQNRVIRGQIRSRRERVEAGETLATSFTSSEHIPVLVARMIAVGEVSGRIEESLERVASYYDREIPRLIQTMVGVFNTGTMLLLGAAITTIALSIFVPLYSMMGNLNAGAQ